METLDHKVQQTWDHARPGGHMPTLINPLGSIMGFLL